MYQSKKTLQTEGIELKTFSMTFERNLKGYLSAAFYRIITLFRADVTIDYEFEVSKNHGKKNPSVQKSSTKASK